MLQLHWTIFRHHSYTFVQKVYRHIVVSLVGVHSLKSGLYGFGKGLRLPWPLLVLLSWYLYLHMHVLSFPLCVCMCWHGWWAAITIACTGLNKDVLRIELSDGWRKEGRCICPTIYFLAWLDIFIRIMLGKEAQSYTMMKHLRLKVIVLNSAVSLLPLTT